MEIGPTPTAPPTNTGAILLIVKEMMTMSGSAPAIRDAVTTRINVSRPDTYA